jgi:hypothetical protein
MPDEMVASVASVGLFHSHARNCHVSISERVITDRQYDSL